MSPDDPGPSRVEYESRYSNLQQQLILVQQTSEARIAALDAKLEHRFSALDSEIGKLVDKFNKMYASRWQLFAASTISATFGFCSAILLHILHLI